MSEPILSNFNSFAKNVHSQYGEDGIVEVILSRLDKALIPAERYCVEFGAWDGKYLSNTYNLIANKGYRAVLIEADPAKFKILCKNIPQETVVKVNEFVTFDGENTLDKLLGRTRIPVNFDFLSIDIDGNDYYILESLKKYRPILICIEYNPTIPNEVDYIQPRDFALKRGAGPGSIVSLASRMGYAVVASTHCNLFLVNREFISALGLIREPTLQDVRDDAESKTFVFCGFDGSIIINRPFAMRWHGLKISAGDLQILPSSLRRFPDDYNPFQWAGLQAFKFVREWKVRFGTLRNKWRS